MSRDADPGTQGDAALTLCDNAALDQCQEERQHALQIAKKPPAIHAVDLFCGIGGLTHGLARSGIAVKAGFDNDESCRHAYEANNPGSQFVHADIRDLVREDLQPYFAGADASVIAGCAPCQPFSAHNRKLKKEADCSLVYELARLVEETQPSIVSMENVPVWPSTMRSLISWTRLSASGTITMLLWSGAPTTDSSEAEAARVACFATWVNPYPPTRRWHAHGARFDWEFASPCGTARRIPMIWHTSRCPYLTSTRGASGSLSLAVPGRTGKLTS